jgi:G:T-mismatch repair DNA endonuclease (very short patch repair protein)
MKAKCIICEIEFEQIRKSHKCCCRKCKDKYTKLKQDKKCLFCGKVFHIDNIEKFCSKECKLKYRDSRFPIKKCFLCKKEFNAKNGSQKFCSSQCKSKVNGYIEVERKCDNCGELYLTNKYKKPSAKIFCCQKCKGNYYREYYRNKMLLRLESGLVKTTQTQPHIISNLILEDLEIKYKNEKRFGRYSVDIYLEDKKISIEVMGTFWHSDIRFFDLKKLYESQLKNIQRDIRKKKHITEDLQIPILYIWEDDLMKNQLLCKKLLQKYYLNNGVLLSYHSSDYILNDQNILLLNPQLKKQYIEQNINITMND